jgi:hypothetical protein
MLNKIRNQSTFAKTLVDSFSQKIGLAESAQLSHKRSSSYYDIPGPRPRPFFGNLLDLATFGGQYNMLNIRKFYFQIQEQYGDVVRFEIMNQRQVYLFNPEHIKAVFKLDASTIPIRPSSDSYVELQKRADYPLTLTNR